MSTQPPEWYHIEDIDELDSPALVIYPERVKENIRLVKTMIDDTGRLRPHVKTSKAKETVLLMMEAGIRKFKCATIAEAEMLGLCRAPDVLLAYQPTGPKLKRFVALIKKYPGTRYSCLADNTRAVEEIAAIAADRQLVIPVYIDLNLGMNRTGIAPGAEAVALYQTIAGRNSLRPAGLHAYDGHIRDTDIRLRTKHCNEAFAAVEKMRDELVQMGYPEPVIIAGGSPTFPIHARRKYVECSPGTFIYWDKGYRDGCPEQPFLTAALVVSRVISLPDDIELCTDLGHKSIAAENEIGRRVFFLNAPDLKAVRQSEEHLVLQATARHPYKVGDVLYGLPVHICPTVALYERAIIIENGRIAGEWKTIARDRKIEI